MSSKVVNRRRLKRVREGDLRRLVQVQERQIAAQTAQLEAMDAVLVGVAELYVYDHVCPKTGMVKKGWQR